MTRQLTTQNATITTAAVEVKTLTISGKQVTLAVFRQLKEEPLIAEDGTLNGEPWGVVNYHPDKCGDAPKHSHVVWQKGSDLCRSRVSAVPGFDYVTPTGATSDSHWYTSTIANRYLTCLVLLGLRTGREPLLSPRSQGLSEIRPETATHMARLELPAEHSETDAFPVMATVSKAAVDATDLAVRYRAAQESINRGFSVYESSHSPDWQAKAISHRRETAQNARLKYEDAMQALEVVVERCGGLVEVKCAYTAEIRAEEARRQRHRDVRADLAELPQLFIAV